METSMTSDQRTCPRCSRANPACGFTKRLKEYRCRDCLKAKNLKWLAKADPLGLRKRWLAMHRRCSCQTDPCYCYYGGRGIRICDEWSSFEAFRDWSMANGFKRELQIDRIDGDGNYEPGNCRFVDATDNSRNSSATKLTVDKVAVIKSRPGDSSRVLAAEFGVSMSTIRSIRIGRCWRDVKPVA